MPGFEKALLHLRLLPAQIKLLPAFLLVVLAFQIFSPIVNLQKTLALNGDANQNGYIWENDDGSSGDGHTQIAAGNTAITAPKGSRLNLRMQVKNTGSSALDLSKLGLFYDHGDGQWSKVRSSETMYNSDANVSRQNSIVDNTGTQTGAYASVAIDKSGTTWAAFYDTTNTALRVAKYVGSGGNCTDTAWNCSAVDNTGTDTGAFTSIAIDNSGTPWVSYADTTNTALRVAKYVGSGGNCTDTAWNCSAVDNTGTSTGQNTSIAIDNSGNPWVSFYDTTNTALRVAKYVGTGGNCTDTAWNCSAVDNTGTSTGQYTSIAIDKSGSPWVAFYGVTSTALRVAKYVGTGGNCTDTAWNCSTVDNTGTDTGQLASIAIDNYGNPLAVYNDTTNAAIRAAKYVGSGGNCTDTAWNCSAIADMGAAGTSPRVGVAIDGSNTAWVGFYNGHSSAFSLTKGEATKLVNTVTSGCSVEVGFECTIVDNTADIGYYSSIAFDTSGSPWVAYYDNTNSNLVAAHYVGKGGNCTSGAWNCQIVDAGPVISGAGLYTSIAIGSSGIPWISYYDANNTSLKVARYTGASGSGCINGWACTTVDNTGTSTGQHTSIAIDGSGNPWVSFYDTTNTALRVAKYVGTGGNCTDTAWNCSAVDNTGTSTGQNTSIAIDNSGNPWVSYYDPTNTALRVAKYVGSGGNCTDTAWNCSAVDNTGTDTGFATAITIDNSGNPWVSYYDTTNVALRVAKYVGTGGNCTDTAWNCSSLDSATNGAGANTSIAVDVNGSPWVSYFNTATTTLRVAKYVGTGGNCTDTAWNCMSIDSTGSVGLSGAIAFSPSGNAWISYLDTTNTALRVARFSRRGEVTIASSQRSSGSITQSHSDMTTTADSGNRTDADCVGGGTWNNGVVFIGEQGGGSVPAGNVTPQCTEVIFTLDFSQAAAGTTYRFIVAINDAVTSGRNFWRGPVSVAGSAIPTITISDITYRFSKDAITRMADCNDTSWGCVALHSSNDVGTFSGPSSLAFSADGTAWKSYYDATNGNLVVAKYVGSSGSGCASSAWTCVTVDSTNDVGKYNALAFDAANNPWVSYYDATGGNLRVAKYVGSSGSGCASSAWTCDTLDSTNDVGQYTSIAFTNSNVPVISYYDVTNGDLRIARFAAGGTLGTGCAVNTWSCVAPETTGTIGSYTSIGVNQHGDVWVSYYDQTNTTLKVMRETGTLSATATCTLYAGWDCTTVETAASGVGQYSSIAFDSSGSPWVSYYDTTNTGLKVANYVTTGGSGCASSAWTCTAVDTSNSVGTYSSIAFDSSGNPWVSFSDDTNNDMRIARYVTSGGSGCTSGAWTCASIETSGTVGTYTSIAFDNSGSPWVGYVDTGNSDLRIAKLHRSSIPLNNLSLYTFTGRSAKSGDARYRLSLGRAGSAADGTCSTGTADYYGICALFHDSGDYDSITAQADESPYLTFAMRYDSTTELPSATWIGKTSLAPNTAGATGDLVLQVYRAGSTNAWETIVSDSTSSGCSSDNCRLSGIPSGTASDYFSAADADGKYWVYFRMYQEASSSTSITLKTDGFKAVQNSARLGTSTFFVDGVRRPLNSR